MNSYEVSYFRPLNKGNDRRVPYKFWCFADSMEAAIEAAFLFDLQTMREDVRADCSNVLVKLLTHPEEAL